MPKNSFKVESPKESSGFLLWQVTTLWQREIKSTLETVGLSHSAFVILASLLWFQEHHTDVTQTTIITHTKLDKMTVSKSLKSLEMEAYVERMAHPIDTRAKSIMITTKGMHVTKKAIKLVEEVDETFFDTLSDTQKQTLNELFLKLQETS